MDEFDRDPEGEKRGNVIVGLGIVLHIAGVGALLEGGRSTESVAMMLLFVGVVLFVRGCTQLARSKGYDTATGMLGIFGVPGWIVLLLLPRKSKDSVV